MIHRRNVRWVVVAGAAGAGLIWLAGAVRFSRPSAPEQDVWRHYRALCEYHQTNDAAVIRRHLTDLCIDTLTNSASSYAERLQCSDTLDLINRQRADERADEALIFAQIASLEHQRTMRRARFNQIALFPALLAGAGALLLFTTKSPNGPPTP